MVGYKLYDYSNTSSFLWWWQKWCRHGAMFWRMTLHSFMSSQSIHASKLLTTFVAIAKGSVFKMNGLMARKVVRSSKGLPANFARTSDMFTQMNCILLHVMCMVCTCNACTGSFVIDIELLLLLLLLLKVEMMIMNRCKLRMNWLMHDGWCNRWNGR